MLAEAWGPIVAPIQPILLSIHPSVIVMCFALTRSRTRERKVSRSSNCRTFFSWRVIVISRSI